MTRRELFLSSLLALAYSLALCLDSHASQRRRRGSGRRAVRP